MYFFLGQRLRGSGSVARLSFSEWLDEDMDNLGRDQYV